MGHGGESDFRHLYTAAYMVRTGHGEKIYDYTSGIRFQTELIFGRDVVLPPFNHLAFETLFFVPFSLLSFKWAYLTFFLVNVALLTIAAKSLSLHLGHLREQWSVLPFAAFACFLPVAITLIHGQDSMILVFLLVLALVCERKGQDVAAGFLLSLTMFKFQYAIPMALLFLAWRKWKLVGAFVAGSSALTFLSLGIAKVSSLALYTKYLASLSVHLGPREQLIYATNPALMPNIRGAIYGLLHSMLPTSVLLWVTTGVSIAIILWASRGTPRFEIAVLVAALCSYHCMITDAAILLLPLTILSDRSPSLELFCWPTYAAPTVLLLTSAVYWPIGFALLALLIWHQKIDGDCGSPEGQLPCLLPTCEPPRARSVSMKILHFLKDPAQMPPRSKERNIEGSKLQILCPYEENFGAEGES